MTHLFCTAVPDNSSVRVRRARRGRLPRKSCVNMQRIIGLSRVYKLDIDEYQFVFLDYSSYRDSK